jgi:RNA polymerase sigma factor (sigma-70 family)
MKDARRGRLRYGSLVQHFPDVEIRRVDKVPFDPKDRQFPETRWSRLLTLGNTASPDYAPNLDQLIRQYWMPVYHYVRALRPVGPAEAEDLTQQFFTMLMDRGSLAKLAPERGSFRGFLKTALRYFLIDQDRAAKAQAPRDGAHFFPFDRAENAWKDARVGVPVSTPEEAFDREWARGVLLDAVSKLKDSLVAEGKELHFKVFAELWNERPLDDPSGGSSHAELARKYALSESDVANYIRFVRQRMRAILKEIVTDYLEPGGNAEDEVRFILS